MKPTDPCIAGIGQTQYWRRGGSPLSEFQLACQAIKAAADDAGIALRQVDGFATFAEFSIDAALLQLSLGIPALRLSASVWGGRGGGACGALAIAADAVRSGRARYVVVFRSIAQSQSRRYGQFYDKRTHANFGAPFGLLSAAQMMALVTTRYLFEKGASASSFERVALSANANAQRNPAAIAHGRPLSAERYRAAPWVAEPLRRHDCCMESEGACALIVTTAERAADSKHRRVQVLAAEQMGPDGWATGPMGSHNQPAETYASGGQHALASALYERAGLGPRDIAVAQIYDHFTPLMLMSLEEFQFCEPGGAPDFVESGAIDWPNGKLPVNTAGGALAEAYVHGLNHLLEGVRQLRGTSTSQVADARTCLVTSASGISPSSAAVLAT